MGTFLLVLALIGILIFIVGAVLYLFKQAPAALVMVIGALIWAISTAITLIDAVF